MRGRVQFDALFIIALDREDEETEILTLKHLILSGRRGKGRFTVNGCLFFNTNQREGRRGFIGDQRQWERQLR